MSFDSIANKHVRGIPVYEPGKPIEEVARELGLKPAGIIKLASNENPLGPSPKALAAMRKAAAGVHLYPDGGAVYLRQALAEHLSAKTPSLQPSITPANLIIGTGSSEIIEFLFHVFVAPGDEIVTGDRSFVLYAIMAEMFQARCVEVPFREHAHDLDAMLRAITPKTKLVFVANPNNPTGTRVSNAALEKFISSLPAHVITVLDEAYIEFLDDPPPSIAWAVGTQASDGGTGLRACRSSAQAETPVPPKVVLLRTFSKIVGLAGLRIGCGIAQAECIALMNRVRQPFNVNALALAGALAALGDTAHIRRTKAVVRRGLAYLEKEFGKLGLEFVPSCANFILVKVGDGDEIFRALQRRGVIVRPMRGYKMPEWVRVTVGLPEENRKFINALRAELDRE